MTDRNYQPTVSERLHNVGDTLRQSLPGRTARVASNELLRGVDNVRGLIRAMYEWMIVPELEMIESMEV